jgi:kelch-like protein 26
LVLFVGQEMRDTGVLCDVTFSVGEVHFLAHRALVAATSSVLGAMLRSGMMETTMPVISFSEDSSTLFQVVLDYLYGVPVEICRSQCINLLGLASKYQLEGLKTQICDCLAAALTPDTCCAVFEAADTHSCPTLREQAITKLFNNFASASKSDGFCELSLMHILEVLSSDRVLDCDEAVVFEAAVRWLQHEPERVTARLEVLSVVRFPLMDAGYLSEVIKPHVMMQQPDTSDLLMEAFEHHALRASGRRGLESMRTCT